MNIDIPSLQKPENENEKLLAWIKELINTQARHVSKPTLKKIMGACGEKCPFSRLTDEKVKDMRNNSESESDFLDSLCKEWRLNREDEKYFVIFDKCSCPLVSQDTNKTSKALCYCTLGKIKRKLALGLGRYVDVAMEGSILAGDRECRFLVKI